MVTHPVAIGIEDIMTGSPRIAAVVVHHRSYQTLGTTVSRLLEEGLEPAKLLIVDNSEDPEHAESLRLSLPQGVQLIFTTNAGYGAAVNIGVSWHARNTAPTDYLLVSTHEALPEPDSLRKLAASLDVRPKAAVIGPALVTGGKSELIWSLGGCFSPVLGLPRHYGHRAARAMLGNVSGRRVGWLDGAFLLFRRAVLDKHPIDEDFFLYMEETDHQLGIQRHGWEVWLEPLAVVWQSSGGTPAFYQTRNIQLFQAKNGSILQQRLSAPYIVATALTRDLIKGRGVTNWKPLLSGWRAGRSLRRKHQASGVTVLVNPLGGALAHYTHALAETLRSSGSEVRVHSLNEPSISGHSRFRWLMNYMGILRTVRSSADGVRATHTLVVWPVLGFIDLLLVRAFCGSEATVVYHDPKPLVRAVGSDPFSARLISSLPDLPKIVVHSEAAAEAMASLGFKVKVEQLAHPMLPPGEEDPKEKDRTQDLPVVRVLGQFKRDRDLDALAALAGQLGADVQLEIVGRGWPELEGWKVDSRFVSEVELDELMSTSSVILIPYVRFYQSGIAIRALESNTPIVGRAETSLADLYGRNSRLLVAGDPTTGVVNEQSWVEAVRYALAEGRGEAAQAAVAYHSVAVSEWKAWGQRYSSMHEGS